jgi:thiosulfate dehydrogenase [quinone] large subunit
MARSLRQRVTPPPRALTLSGWALLPLRAFLGFTFCFAGLQKLANPNFFKASDPSGIYAQLVASNRISPLHPILGHLLGFSTPVGVIIALGEVAVGIGVILGLWTRVAAIGGAIISFSLFLTVSYHASPWYTGADIVFFFAWIPLILAGSGRVLSVDPVIAARVHTDRRHGAGAPVSVPFGLIQRICGHYEAGRCAALGGAACDAGPCPYLREADSGAAPEPVDLNRRRLVLGGAATAAAGVAALVVAGAAAGIGRAVGGSKAEPGTVTLAPTTAGPTSTTTTAPGTSTPTSTPTSTATTEPPGVAIGPAKEVAVGSWAAFTDPTTHTPSLVIQLAKGRFVAYDAICPHAGCTVGYVPSESIIACPCHGSEFNPDNGDVVQGPATRGLRTLGVAEGTDGQLYIEG